jgi:putative transposase
MGRPKRAADGGLVYHVLNRANAKMTIFDHFFTVCRYVERNALRANLVQRAQDWRWGSLHRWQFGNAKEKSLLAAWPLRRLAGWVEEVNTPQTEVELAALRRSVSRGCPFGEAPWSDRIVHRLGLESTLRPQGRPRKQENGSWHLCQEFDRARF